MIDVIGFYLRLRAHVAVGRGVLLDDKHASEIPGNMVGGKAGFRRDIIRQPDVGQGGNIGLPGGKLPGRFDAACREPQRLQGRWQDFRCCRLLRSRKAAALRVQGFSVLAPLRVLRLA